MRDIVLKGVRLVDSLAGTVREGCDLHLRDGLVEELGEELSPPSGSLVLERPGTVVAPAFLDLHCHLREPGQAWKERIGRATEAAAAGGFGAVCGMANLRPPVDGLGRLRECLDFGRELGRLPVLQFAACTLGLEGKRLVDFRELAGAGAAGFSDDGRNGCDEALLSEALTRAGELGLVVAIHPESEAVLAGANPGGGDPTAWARRPAEAEAAAVELGIRALRRAGSGRLHLQHLSTARATDLLRRARREGLAVTAEVSPHHLTLGGPQVDPEAPGQPLRCNPPLREAADRQALWEALTDGTIDAIASDHAPHELPSEPPQPRAPGFSGVQTVLSAVLSRDGGGDLLPTVLRALTLGPRRVLGRSGAGLPKTGPTPGQPADLTWFDPAASWSPGPHNWLSQGANTPYWGRSLPGQVLATFAKGRAVFASPCSGLEAARV